MQSRAQSSVGIACARGPALGAALSALLLSIICVFATVDDLRRSSPPPVLKVGRVVRSGRESPPRRSRILPVGPGINTEAKRRRRRRSLRRQGPIGLEVVRATMGRPNRQFAFLCSAAEQSNANRRFRCRFVARTTPRLIGSWRQSRRRLRRRSSSPMSNSYGRGGGRGRLFLVCIYGVGIRRKIILACATRQSRIMAAETHLLRPIDQRNSHGSAPAHRAHTMGDGLARWFGRNRSTGRAGSLRPPSSKVNDGGGRFT